MTLDSGLLFEGHPIDIVDANSLVVLRV